VTSSQRAVVALGLLPLLEKEARERQLRGTTLAKTLAKVGSNGTGKASQVAAGMTNTNSAYVQAVKNIQQQAPELVEKIRLGVLRVPDAVRLARLPKKEWKGVLRLCDGYRMSASELRDLTRQVARRTSS
jgi:hypothetical protein